MKSSGGMEQVDDPQRKGKKEESVSSQYREKIVIGVGNRNFLGTDEVESEFPKVPAVVSASGVQPPQTTARRITRVRMSHLE